MSRLNDDARPQDKLKDGDTAGPLRDSNNESIERDCWIQIFDLMEVRRKTHADGISFDTSIEEYVADPRSDEEATWERQPTRTPML